MIVYDINELANKFNDKAFHLFSEKHFRGQVIRFDKEQKAMDYKLDGVSLIMIVISGKVKIKVDETFYTLEPELQAVIPEGSILGVIAIEDSIVEYIWSPGLYT